MTFDRSIDDLPLAAYGGSGMELTADDEAKIDAALPLEVAVEAIDPAPVPPGAFAHASVAEAPLEGEPVPRTPARAGDHGARAPASIALLRTSRPAQGAAFAGVIVVGLLLLVGGMPKPGAAGAARAQARSPSSPRRVSLGSRRSS